MHINIKYMLAIIVGIFLVLTILVLYAIHMAGESKPPKTIQESDEIFTTDDNTVIFYFTDWCPSCKNIKPLWEQAKSEIQDLKFVEVNTDNEESPDYIKSVPTIIFGNKKYNNVIDYDSLYEFLTSKENPEVE